jgi:hypothetical protein
VHSSNFPSSIYGEAGNDVRARHRRHAGACGNDLIRGQDRTSDVTIQCASGSDKADLDLLSLDPNV